MKFTATSMLILSVPTLLMSMYMLILNMFISINLPLINIMSINISIDIILDWMSLMFLSTVMFISSLIIMFSMYYIPEKEHNLFISLLMMFVLSMGILIISNNIFLILLGWDGLGLSSYILVIYYQNFTSAASGSITLLSNRIGDILILMSISILMISSNWNFNMNKEFMMLPMIFLLIAACSKSAQFPFSAWLPMAMAAPTPISALVHSSTLVTAGVFISLRILNTSHPITMLTLMTIASATAIYSSMSANWEQDLKKIIALSTLSQIAMMMFAISIGSSLLAFSHLIIHALFKSTMFLCAGIMIHESSYQDMRMMGMNFMSIPLTTSILGITSMALMGIPFMSGFFSKDAIIENLISLKLESLLSIMMIMSIGMTASYSMRMSFLSNKSAMKSHPLSSNHSKMWCSIPITIMSPLTIISGTWMTWTINPDQSFLINLSLKMMIIIMLISGFILGMMLSFKSHKYISMGESSISLWFTHFMTSSPMKISSPLMMIYSNNDKLWQEMYGPQKTYISLKTSSTLPETSKSTLLLITIMLMMIPPLFIS
uniref:NADH-ubiquinone oxidoreductase chain 5 n=1 Tax=Selenops bursarius TaxID=881841 RepID=A0A0U1V5S4_9ARAC|nr:NADH dehydrogenase subunit 5 [Selenops bursarius]AIM52659.1 NADH dehydrogenase subunit 5 [Selenops bursarius]